MPATTAFDKAFALAMEREGHDTNDPLDSGGLTRFGIAQEMNPDVDVRTITLDDAKEFYRNRYWSAIRLDDVAELSTRVAVKLFDIAVSQGQARAQSWLQVAVDPSGRYVAHDGKIGKQTVEALRLAIDEGKEERIIESLRISSLRQRISRVKEKPDQIRFLEGWILRSIDKDGRFA